MLALLLGLCGDKSDAAKLTAAVDAQPLPERARENLREEIEFLRGLRPADIREARKRIVGIVRQLEEAGAIVIERAGGEGAV